MNAASKAVLLAAPVALAVVILIERRPVGRALRAFFDTEDHPLNLAIFRIAVFGTILVELFALREAHEAIEFSRVPKALLVAPFPLNHGGILSDLPLNPGLTTILVAILALTATLALVGLYARVNAAVTVLISIYVLGVPEFFGFVHHNHNLLWFAAVLAASRSGDALSIDALRRAGRRADEGDVEPPGPSRGYALPIRFVWLVMGLIYFFPGLWKFRVSGFRWALSDNLRNLMWDLWTPTGHAPPIRVDTVPLLYKGAGLAAMAFELSFIFLVIFPATRRVIRFVGLAFHNTTGLLLQIPFWELQACYVSFFNWHGIFRWLGRQAWGRELYVIYDGNCRLCRRAVARLRVVDLAQRITYLDRSEPTALAAQGLTRFDRAVPASGVLVAEGNEVLTGYDARRRLVGRIPLLWPVLPLLAVALSRRWTYRRHADGRLPALAKARKPQVIASSRLAAYPAALVGVPLVLALGVCGAHDEEAAWPIAMYPSFAAVEESTTFTLTTFSTQVVGGPARALSLSDVFGSWTARERYEALVNNVFGTKDPNVRVHRFAALWVVVRQHVPTMKPVTHVYVYQYKVSTQPSDLHKQPLGLADLYSFAVHPQRGGADFTVSAG